MVLIPFFLLWFIGKCINLAIAAAQEEKMRKIREEQERIRAEQAWMREEAKREEARRKALEKEQERQAKEQARLAKEQERQAAQAAKHEEMLLKLDQKLAVAEREIEFNREQRERLWKLLEIEELERDSSISGSTAWQKHQRKVIALENQIHTVQKRIDKAQLDKVFCEKKMSA